MTQVFSKGDHNPTPLLRTVPKSQIHIALSVLPPRSPLPAKVTQTARLPVGAVTRTQHCGDGPNPTLLSSTHPKRQIKQLQGLTFQGSQDIKHPSP